MAETDQADLTSLTVQLLSAYVSNNSVPSNELAALIDTTRAALAGQPEAAAQAAPEYVPAVSLRKSLSSRDHILSMIDGRPYKTLKRHLASHGLTPAEYRERYKLSPNYPMVAPNYSEQRRDVAARLGLGRRPAGATGGANGGAAIAESTPPAAQPAVAQPKKRTGSKPAAAEASPKPKERARARSPKEAAPETEAATQPAARKRRAQTAAAARPDTAQPQAEKAKASPRRRSRKEAGSATAAE